MTGSKRSTFRRLLDSAAELSEDSCLFPEITIADHVEDLLGAGYGNVEQIRPTTCPSSGSGLSRKRGSKYQNDRFGLTALNRVHGSNALTSPAIRGFDPVGQNAACTNALAQPVLHDDERRDNVEAWFHTSVFKAMEDPQNSFTFRITPFVQAIAFDMMPR